MKKKKDVKCVKCQNFDGENCHKNGNIGIVIKYRQEKQVFLKKPEEINQDGTCASYVRA